MMIPSFYVFTSLGDFFQSLSSSFLFTSLGYSPYVHIEQYSIFRTLGILFRNIILGLIITFPGFIYNYKIVQIPLKKSYWKMGFGVCIALVANTVGVVYFILPIFISRIHLHISEYYSVSMQLAIFPVLVMAAFIILPLIQRQAVSIASPFEIHDQNMREIMLLSELKIKREMRVAIILWVVICFVPSFVGLAYYIWRAYYFVGLFYIFTLNTDVYFDFIAVSIYGAIANLADIQITALSSVGNFYFVREIYRYLRKEVTRKRLMLVGLMATLYPLIIRMVFPSMFYYYYNVVIPLPFVFLAGLLVVKLHRPIIGLTDRIWREDEPRYWWDEEKKKEEEGVSTTPGTPYRYREDIVKVPLYYIIISRIKNLRKRNKD